MNTPTVKLTFIGYQDGLDEKIALYNIVSSEYPALAVGSTVCLNTVQKHGCRVEYLEPPLFTPRFIRHWHSRGGETSSRVEESSDSDGRPLAEAVAAVRSGAAVAPGSFSTARSC